jgi:hypothetical protein
MISLELKTVELIPIDNEGKTLEVRLRSAGFLDDKNHKKLHLFCKKHGRVLTKRDYYKYRCFDKEYKFQKGYCRFLINYVLLEIKNVQPKTI